MRSLRNGVALLFIAIFISSCGLIQPIPEASQVTEGVTTVTEQSAADVIATVIDTEETDAEVSTEIPEAVVETTSVSTEAVIETTQHTTTPEPTLDTQASIFTPLEQLLQDPPVWGAKVAFTYEDITTGTSYSYNGDELMWSASVMKLPFDLSILYKAESEDMGLDDVFVYTGNENTDGTGEIKNMPIGSAFTNIELIEYSLRYSDNVAHRHLWKKHGRDGYFEFVRSIDADSFTEDGGWGITASDGVKVLRSAWEYIEGGYTYSERIKTAMLNTRHQVMLSPGLSGKEFARKYGWDEDGYNDVGIVYDDHPYMLVFLSDMTSGGGTVNGYITKIAYTIDGIHEEMWGTHENTSAYTVINTVQEESLWDAGPEI